MVTNDAIKRIRSLVHKKYRREHRQFVIEGTRIVSEAVESGTPINQIYLTESWAANPQHQDLIRKIRENDTYCVKVSNSIMKKLSGAVTPPGIIGVCPLPKFNTPDFSISANWLYLDRISDPGNLGTLLRTAAWFAVTNIALSQDCIDPYNPKVVRSGMGAHFHLDIHNNVDLQLFNNAIHFLIGAMPDGESLDKLSHDKLKPWVLVLGNEAHGISSNNIPLLNYTIAVSKLGYGESLNVAVAGGIILHQLVSDRSGV